MPRGHKPQDETPLTNAERQARYRARHHMVPTAVPVRVRKSSGRRSRPQRWHDAVAGLLALQADYAAWLEALPATLHDTATAGALQAIVDLDLARSVVWSLRQVILHPLLLSAEEALDVGGVPTVLVRRREQVVLPHDAEGLRQVVPKLGGSWSRICRYGDVQREAAAASVAMLIQRLRTNETVPR